MSSPSVEIVKAMPQAQDVFLPVMSMDVALERRETIIKFVQQIMKEDQDYGVIPGTSSKPVLLKPGAEKLCNFFGLEPEFTPIFEEADWTGEHHGGQPFYYIRYRCRLMRNGQVLGVGEGSCNSWESKYRYRNANRKCPSCGQEAIIVGKAEYGGGFVCFKKKGGCGAKFDEDDQRIASQAVGRVINPDMADSVNTIQKMAQKRALVPATLLATSGSEFFTQDLEDNPTEPADHQRNTPAEQAALAERRIQETRDDGSAGESSEGRHSPTPTQPAEKAPDVPGPLRSLFDNMQQGRAGAVRQAFDFMKAQLKEAMPTTGEAEYKRICEKHELRAGTAIKLCIPALLEMWELGEFAREQARKAAPGYKAEDADIPFEAEPEEAVQK